MNYKAEDLALQLRQARENAAMSQRDLSARSGVTQSHISQIESGKLSPGIGTMIDIGRALDLELVFIPKRSMSAVNSLIQHTPARHGLTPESGRAALSLISRGERLVTEVKKVNGSFADLDRADEYLRFLKRVSMQPDEIKIIASVVDLLDHYESGMQWGVEFMQAVRQLQTLRNKIGHGRSDEPRSAYGFYEEDEDA
jgi:transcriptional regulator with XRE-family HTH domain